MSERIIIAKRNLTCDICKQRIPAGTKCRVIKDDFMPGIFYFEHIKCPSAPAVAVDHKPLLPINKKEIAFA
ncbi:MAG: hypothetical protein J6C40_09020 [Lentisphaeria bacterium]|nr:hypothetical protein [Lentisphaeria bacterium]